MAQLINHVDYANTANELLRSHQVKMQKGVILTDIPYVSNSSDLGGMDCQGQMEYILRQFGIKANWRGSNDMFRNACSWTGTIAECKELFGQIPKGAWLFIVKNDGGEVARGYKDGLGNASHVGAYTGIDAGVVHASASRNCVASSTLKNGWTHVGLCKYIDYDVGVPAENKKEVIEVRVMEKQMEVFAENGSNVNLRDSINGGLVARVPIGSKVTAINVSEDWTKIVYKGQTGWMMSKYLRDVGGSADSGMYEIYLEATTAKALKDALELAGV